MSRQLSPEQYSHVNRVREYLLGMSKPPPRTFGERVRAAREEAGLTQVQLAYKSGLGQSAISSIENGNTRWSRGHNLLALAHCLDVAPEWLETGRGPSRPGSDDPDTSFAEHWKKLTPDNKRRLIAMCHALLRDQVAQLSATPQSPQSPRKR